MWNERFLKVIPGCLFLFCLLQFFELLLIINEAQNTEKIEAQLQKNLETLQTINLSNRNLECMGLEHYKKIKIK